ncbi:NADH dehydrogenase [ubiquinone] flavoprotein 1, mitochondrial [Ceratobasidium sp. 428]|nr:NADH dehydrogenase [ubiquinone] flavoprotein 1, mitochondrial [Ceratobasidium sp. 428]
MDFDSLKDAQSGLVTGTVIVMNKYTDVVKAIARFSKFYKHESCRQCTPYREGATWTQNMMNRMGVGRAHQREIDMLLELTKQVEGKTICALGDAAAWSIQGLMRHFRSEVGRRIAEYRAANGPVLSDGKLKSDTGFRLAVPDNLGENLVEEPRVWMFWFDGGGCKTTTLRLYELCPTCFLEYA